MQAEARRDLSAFADNLRVARVRARLTQTQLAERIGSRQDYIGRLERGYRPVRDEHVQQIADALGVSVASLLARTPGAASIYDLRTPAGVAA